MRCIEWQSNLLNHQITNTIHSINTRKTKDGSLCHCAIVHVKVNFDIVTNSPHIICAHNGIFSISLEMENYCVYVTTLLLSLYISLNKCHQRNSSKMQIIKIPQKTIHILYTLYVIHICCIMKPFLIDKNVPFMEYTKAYTSFK